MKALHGQRSTKARNLSLPTGGHGSIYLASCPREHFPLAPCSDFSVFTLLSAAVSEWSERMLMRLSRYHTSQAPHVWDAASSCSLLTWLSLHLLLSFPFPFFSPTHQVLSSPSRVRRFVVFCLSATDLGGPGLHDWGVPVDEYCDFVFKKNLEGDQEFGYQFSEKARLYTQTKPHTHPHKHKHKHTD